VKEFAKGGGKKAPQHCSRIHGSGHLYFPVILGHEDKKKQRGFGLESYRNTSRLVRNFFISEVSE